MNRSVLLAASALAAVTLVAAGCGDTDEIPADAVAVVDGTSITRASLDELLARAKKSYTAQQRDFPKAGTPEYQSLQNQAVAYLVQREEYAREADDLQAGINVTRKIMQKVPMIPALKAVTAHFSNDPSWKTVRPPLTELTADQEKQVITELKASGFSMPGL